MPIRLALSLLLLTAAPLAAQTPLTRSVSHGVLASKSDPAASFVVDSTFHYFGGQTIDILKVAGAEQYFFIDAGADHAIRRFYWVQFEHYYPTNTYTYDYSGIRQQPVAMGALSLMGDVRTSPHYFTMDDRPGSDSRAAETFLRKQGLALDGTFVTLRLFHLPDGSRRREVMIIYGELLGASESADQRAAEIVRHAQAGLTIR